MPTVTDVRSGRRSERTRTPLARRVASMRLRLRPLLRVLLEGFLPGQADPSRLVDLEHLDVDDVAFLEDVRDLPDPFVGELRDVDEAVRPREYLDERAE